MTRSTTRSAVGLVPTPRRCSPAGGMGFPSINISRMMAPIDPARPSILLYAPDREGEMKMLGAEWLRAVAGQDLGPAGDRPTLGNPRVICS